MKKKVKSFADRAKEIQNKYPRAEWDKIERRDMLKELGELRDEQETYRNMSGDNMGDGEPVTKFDTGGGILSRMLASQGVKTYDPNSLVKLNLNNSIGGNTSYYQPLTTPFAPTAISAISSLIGDFAGLKALRKSAPDSVALPRVISQDISLEPERQALKRNYNSAINIALRNSRNASNPSNAYANEIAGISGLTDSLGTQLGQSYMNEANTNTQARNQAAMENAQIGSQEALTNFQNKQQKTKDELQYINSIAETIPSALKDYRAQVYQNNMLNVMGKDYGLYEKVDPNMTNRQKFLRSLLGNPYAVLPRLSTNIKQ